MKPRKTNVSLHGRGEREHELYVMVARPPADHWAAITDVPCPVEGCKQTLVWYEAGYVPGYRVCMAPDVGGFDMDTLRHRFLAGFLFGRGLTLIRDDCCEE